MQDIVKILKYIAPVLSAFLLVPGCAEEEIYEKGQPENPDCYGVWFPTQTASTNLFLESDDPTEVTYKVRRTKVIDEITVPVVVSASEDGIFEVEPLVFAAGEEEADLKVTFPNAQMGVTYTCDIKVEDPDYVQIYGSNSTGLSFTVLRANWKSLGTGKWRDDIFSSLYNVTNSYAEIDVEIFEREDSPGYYRMQVFTQQLIEALFGVGVQTQGLMTIVDATDPEAVYIPVQETGVELSSTDGSIKIGSYVSENFSLDASDSQYGTMTEGVITFPQQSIAVNFSTMGDLWYSANTSGMLRIMLPGAKVYDYNVKFTKSEPANGSVTIGVDLSDDVAFMGYKVFEGALDDAQASLNAQDMNDAYVTDGTSAFTGVVSADRNLRISCPETGEYTLVACLYGGEENSGMTGYGFITFGYVASGDDMPVILTAGLEQTNEYGGQGYTTDNSIKFYAYGEDIRSFDWGMFRNKDIAGLGEEDWEMVLDDAGESFSEDELKQLNAGHYSRLLTGLNGDSDYTLILRAYNGYYTVYKTFSCHTTGKFNPALEVYEYSDFLSDQPSKRDLTSVKWNYYATNYMEENPVRKLIGQVTIEESAADQSGIDFMTIYGISGVEFDTGGGIPVVYMPNSAATEGYNGVLALYSDGNSLGTIDGQPVYGAFIAEEDGNAYNGVGMYAGAVADGYIYFVPSPAILEQGYTLSYFYTGGTTTAYSLMGEMMLVDPAKDMGGLPDGASERISALRAKALGFHSPDNFVELPVDWTAPEAMTSGKKTPANMAQASIPASAPKAKAADARVTDSDYQAPVQTGTGFSMTGSAPRKMTLAE